MSPYDEAMRIVCDIVISQQMWPSQRMLRMDLAKALDLLREPGDEAGAVAASSSSDQLSPAAAPLIEHVIEIDEDGKVSEPVNGPIRDNR